MKKESILIACLLCVCALKPEAPFPLRAWKRASFFVSFIDLRLKRAVNFEASAKKKAIKQTKNAFFHTRSGNGP